ncbi:pyridine nucleotide-disulfide oxidoreductase family protein [Conidiobolus coronatus NRRL 28638]|uniref:NADH:ubiquinone reductase (non-electrogenic) n=1 Tax=Conidiobolus coronatus (strain ATCC 28846 / CBS 209.66 / NRRL 28638) TaxID=796925 RepID=A0A137NY07_CONC2|nr:pyridine nucleotide-disulfide oxidoreductase family protein [Conidiobolus coronatus NRRL 28638]|eukprot:KXN67666.1 pyridine nucleotide-disulfide oxidoreductase family protein [Conidiobolus coronatus NRRL 28638]
MIRIGTRLLNVKSHSRLHTSQFANLNSRFQSTNSNGKNKGGFEWAKKGARFGYRGIVIGLQLTLAYVVISAYMHNNPRPYTLRNKEELKTDKKKQIVILGTGWGSTSFLKAINSNNYDITVVSPRNYFLFTPLLPSCTVGTLEYRSIVEPIRYITRHMPGQVRFVEAECTKIDHENNRITITDSSEIQGEVNSSTIDYDYLVVGCGAETATFGIPGVKEHACFLKEIDHAKEIRRKISDCLETATFEGQQSKEQDRLLHMVVVGGGPTGVEYAAELHDFLEDDLKKWYPDMAGKFKITLIEAMNNVLPSFSKKMIKYTEATFKQNNIEILNNTMVKEVKERSVVVQNPNKELVEIPCGLLVWAGGNMMRPVVRDLISNFPEAQTNRRGVTVNDHLLMNGSQNIFVLGDAAATQYAPTAQVASQQGKYLARVFKGLNKADTGDIKDQAQLIEEMHKNTRPFHYTHQGSLAYIGSEKAIADIPFLDSTYSFGGVATLMFWKSAYLSNLFSVRNRYLVISDWTKTMFYGRDIARE